MSQVCLGGVLIGATGLILNRFSIVQCLLSFEVVVLGLILGLSFTPVFLGSVYPAILTTMIFFMSAIEISFGLTLIVMLHKAKSTLSLSSVSFCR